MASPVNRYHLALKLPVSLTFPDYPVPNTSKHYHTRFHKADMDEAFKKWLYLRGVYVVAGEYFYTPPRRTLEPHSDSVYIDDAVKLNWMKEGGGSVMEWYDLKPGSSLKIGTTSINTHYSYAPREDLIRVHTATIGTPSLVNIGQIHAIQNGNFPRYVACVVLGDLQTNKRLQWDRARKIFEDCVIL